MNQKKYQVFVSSTYEDLIDERKQVMHAVMMLGHIPAGMEYFPAMDEEQFQYIKRVIDDCDYYILILGGRYGSTDQAGIGYTEKEFDYAFENNLKPIVLLHSDPGKISSEKSETSDESRSKYAAFRKKLQTNRMTKYWNCKEEIQGLTMQGLLYATNLYPKTGWVRANQANESILLELNDVRKENSKLLEIIEKSKEQNYVLIENIADFDSEFILKGTFNPYMGHTQIWELCLSWRKIFTMISPLIEKQLSEDSLKEDFESIIQKAKNISSMYFSIDTQVFHKIRLQLVVYKLINTTLDDKKNFVWLLTDKGTRVMLENGIVCTEN